MDRRNQNGEDQQLLSEQDYDDQYQMEQDLSIRDINGADSQQNIEDQNTEIQAQEQPTTVQLGSSNQKVKEQSKKYYYKSTCNFQSLIHHLVKNRNKLNYLRDIDYFDNYLKNQINNCFSYGQTGLKNFFELPHFRLSLYITQKILDSDYRSLL